MVRPLLPLLLALSGCTGSSGGERPGAPAPVEEDSAAEVESPPAPQGVLTSTPALLSFGVVPPGSQASATLSLGNAGDAPLVVSGFEFEDPAFSADSALPIELSPGEGADVIFTYTSADEEMHRGWLRLVSDVGREVMEVLAYGSPEPIAVCEAPAAERVGEPVALRGGDSWDPADVPLVAWDWSLTSAPEGSVAEIPAGEASPTFVADVAGTYVATLVVTNADGLVSAPCAVSFTAYEALDLGVELVWTRSGDDMDLHLVRPGGSLVSDGDCYYANCAAEGALDWGVRGSPADNPWLETDDIPGTGPEYISLESPEEGTFTVYVHDYPGSVYNGANEVTVNVSFGGVLEWSDTRTLSTEDEYVPFVDITFPGGLLTSR